MCVYVYFCESLSTQISVHPHWDSTVGGGHSHQRDSLIHFIQKREQGRETMIEGAHRRERKRDEERERKREEEREREQGRKTMMEGAHRRERKRRHRWRIRVAQIAGSASAAIMRATGAQGTAGTDQ